MRGNVYAWVVILGMLFFTIQIWIIFSQIYSGHFWPWAEDQFDELNMTTEKTTLTHLQNYWNYWPLVFIGGLTIYGIASSLKKEPESAYYGI